MNEPIEVRIITCTCCGGDGGWSAERPGQSWLTCRACDGTGVEEVTVESLDAEEFEYLNSAESRGDRQWEQRGER